MYSTSFLLRMATREMPSSFLRSRFVFYIYSSAHNLMLAILMDISFLTAGSVTKESHGTI